MAGAPKPPCTHWCSYDWHQKTPRWLGHKLKGSLSHYLVESWSSFRVVQISIFTFTCCWCVISILLCLIPGPISKRVENVPLYGLMEEPLKQPDPNMTQVHYVQCNNEASKTTPKTSSEGLWIMNSLRHHFSVSPTSSNIVLRHNRIQKIHIDSNLVQPQVGLERAVIGLDKFLLRFRSQFLPFFSVSGTKPTTLLLKGSQAYTRSI